VCVAEDLPLRVLLERANRVLPAVKQPEMYATFAGPYSRTNGELEYCIAGHPPILHYQAQTKKVQSYRMEQFPLGLEPKCQYASATTNCGPDDVFMLLSDGILEATDAARSEFGLERVRSLLEQHGRKPLQEIVANLMKELESFGPRNDNQTILLVRMLRR
jgi:sigma-B regulation protein RsbU (phosphoserine phosphatase)